MATRRGTIDFLLEQMAAAGAVEARKMFGEYALYCDGRIVALVCDDQLFVKPTAAGKAFIGGFVEGCPYPGAKPSLLIPGDRWDDREWLTQLVRRTAANLATPKKKPGRTRQAWTAAARSIGLTGPRQPGTSIYHAI